MRVGIAVGTRPGELRVGDQFSEALSSIFILFGADRCTEMGNHAIADRPGGGRIAGDDRRDSRLRPVDWHDGGEREIPGFVREAFALHNVEARLASNQLMRTAETQPNVRQQGAVFTCAGEESAAAALLGDVADVRVVGVAGDDDADRRVELVEDWENRSSQPLA
ncbi:MAG TPA: hypothetical protein VNS11_05595 [Sphingomicrobium sp.]|nr:hypothetical protein [Sphingomicrobium sp.]